MYITLSVLGWEGRPRQVLMLDAHPPGPLDILWPVVAAGGGTAALAAVRTKQATAIASVRGGGTALVPHPWDVPLPEADGGGSGGRLLVRRAGELQAPLRFRHAAFVPPGYASLLFAHLHEPSSCPLPTALFAGFRSFLLEAFGLGGDGAQPAAAAAGTAGDDASSSGADGAALLTVYLVVRRPAAHRRMARQIGNEAALLGALQALDAGLSILLIDLAGWSGGGPCRLLLCCRRPSRGTCPHTAPPCAAPLWPQWRSSWGWCSAQTS